MDDDSPSDRANGRSFWSGMRTLLFGEGSEATLRDEIEEAIESREGEAPRIGDLSEIERQRIEAFFRIYKDLPEGSNPVQLSGWGDAAEARALIGRALERYRGE